MLKNDKKSKFNKKNPKKKPKSPFNKRATPPTRERAKRADQHVYAFARKIKKINIKTLKSPKNQILNVIRTPSHSHFVLAAFKHSNSPFGLVFVLKRRPSVRPPASLWDVKPQKKMPVFQTFLMSRPLLKFFLRLTIFLGVDLNVSSKNTPFTAKLNFKNRVQISRNSHFFEPLFSFFFSLFSFFFLFFFRGSGTQKNS